MAIIHFPLRRLRDKFFPNLLPSAGCFKGCSVLVTGSTTGLGLAAAVHFASLGAEVIITSREKSRGESARQKVEEGAGICGKDNVHVMLLDMMSYSSCVLFVNELKRSRKGRDGLDYVVLNAGGVSPTFTKTPEGMEQTIQVNALSTTLIALLLLPWMKQNQTLNRTPSHLVFVTSRAHLDADITDWARWAEQEGILEHLSTPQNFPSDRLRPNYDNSKLILTYAVQEICKQALGVESTPQVIVNTVCPGLVHTDIGREVVRHSLFMRAFVPLWLGILGKSADYGARIYIIACLTSQNEHGKFLQTLYTEDEYESMAIPNLKSGKAREVQALVWREITAELRSKVSILEINE